MTDYALLIIDMQESFIAAQDLDTILEVKKQIAKAIMDKAQIIFASYSKFGPIIADLIQMIRNYPNVIFVNDCVDDKGRCISNKLIKDGSAGLIKNPSLVKICGVNTDGCVMSTAISLSKMYPNTRVLLILKACNTYHKGTDSVTFKINAMVQSYHNISVKI